MIDVDVDVVDMLLFCPRCNRQHIDTPTGDWTNPPHATHWCHNCGLLWRPSNVNTNGVELLDVVEEKHIERADACFPEYHQGFINSKHGRAL